MSKIRVLIYRLDIHNLQTKTVSCPDQEKILKETVFDLAVSMNANTENSQIKYYSCPKCCKKLLRNKVLRFRDFLANLRKFGTAKYLIWKHSRNLISAKKFNFSDTKCFREKYFFLQELVIKYVFVSTCLAKLIFLSLYPLNRLRKE